MSTPVHLITGATNGIGRVTALACAKSGATVVFVGRNEGKCKVLLAEIVAAGNDHCEYLIADLSVLDQVRGVAERFLARHDRLDVLINNAGAFFADRRDTADGIEQTWALNHLAYFLLTELLLDTLKASAPARIVSTSSDAHRGASMNFDDLEYTQSYPQAGFAAYCRSKLANLQWTLALDRRLQGSGVTAVAVHPGYVQSGFGLNNTGFLKTVMTVGGVLFARSETKGARGLIHCALSPDMADVSGVYWMDHKPRASSKLARDEAIQEQLWQVTAAQLGLGSDRVSRPTTLG
jgi:NAD(P)-dependent dehydrogenase (short-subunit alcohol dehydrogenase family)